MIISKFIAAKRFHSSAFSNFASMFGSDRFVVCMKLYGDRVASEGKCSSSSSSFVCASDFTGERRHVVVKTKTEAVARRRRVTVDERWMSRWTGETSVARGMEETFVFVVVLISGFGQIVGRRRTNGQHRFQCQLRLQVGQHGMT